MTLEAFGPAKINLFLHVGAPAADGFHPLVSWMSFADVGDRLTLEPGEGRSLVIDGPFAKGLSATDNLVLQAAEAILPSGVGARLRLHKALPVASGLGGGSSDAGAAFRLLREAYSLPLDDAALERAAAGLGADGAACLWARPVIAEGRGERLSPAPAAPVVDAVLVNPGVPSPTGAVYRAYDEAVVGAADRPWLPERFDGLPALVETLRACRNDLEVPAARLEPLIEECLALLRAQPQALLARLSGSGATCFAFCDSRQSAERLAGEVSAARPEWWVRACKIGAPSPQAVPRSRRAVNKPPP